MLIPVGWKEWLALPDIGVPAVKAKVDTGARTSALHAYFVEPFRRDGREWVRFGLHPLQRRSDIERICEALVKDRRTVTDSGGHREVRYFIETTIRFAGLEWRADMTLTNRETMRFRMLLGRTSLAGRFTVDPQAAYIQGKRPRQAYAGEGHTP